MAMKKIVSRSSLIELAPYEFGLSAADIKFRRKNEFISGAIGELPFTEVWPELWLIDDAHFDQAQQICQRIEQEVNQQQVDWSCVGCEEENANSFEFCWSCGELRRV
ncbi:DUF2007 domain-containing protein [uncultured Psychrosphaera sp.]|uniref:putative signal transducing protein n=1 Tax=uncultured Psychrosphaera sp. TaxID=1403522 RepID=UPI002602AFCB|nr:DUF2007 domain-containing protein [uncultured Psychrosphaera sp.]